MEQQQPIRATGKRGLSLFLYCAGILSAAVLLGAGVALINPVDFGIGWMAAALLLAFSFFLLVAAWQWGGAGRLLAWLMILAFVLRLGIGIGLSQALPVWGYRGETNLSSMAGYLFKDAYERDNRAWQIAQTGDPLWVSFRDDLKTDQYGGLLALSAGIYRYLSPDFHRPYLVMILGAFFSTLGVPFLRKAILLRWNVRIATLAAWIYVLYPDAIFFQSSQMREPFLVGLMAVGIWAILALDRSRRAPRLALLGSLAGMVLFSSRVAVVAAGALVVLFLLDRVVARQERGWQAAGWLALSAGAVGLLAFSWVWFRTSAGWDVLVTMRNSGWILRVIREVGEQWAWPITILYGFAQPVLPAAIAEPSIPLWKTIAIIRSVGWYALAPFLIYGMLAVWKDFRPKRRLMVGVALTLAVWMVIASLRGGGDQTDNPRYRTLFIPWMALLAGWGVDWALSHRDAWLWRALAVEAIFLGFFTDWYFSRYFHLFGRLPFWAMVACIVVCSALVLVGGWIWDRRFRKTRLARDEL